MGEHTHDIVVIGAGSAGLTGAWFAQKLGAKVALVEKERVGGDCTWTGCVPSKALLHAAKTVHLARHAPFFASKVKLDVDMKKVRDYVQARIQEVYQHETPASLEEQGIEVIEGAARFVSPEEAVVTTPSGTTKRLRARAFLVCTGASAWLPDVEGLDEIEPLTHRDIFDLDTLPPRLAVVGAGPIGCELAQAFAFLGSDVTVIGPHMLPRDEPAARDVVRGAMEDAGVTFALGAVVEKIAHRRSGYALWAGGKIFEVDRALIATGRRANIAGLGLEEIGVELGERGIKVNRALQTNHETIFAAGDCLGGPQFTHYAGWQAFIAVRNALLPGNAEGFPTAVPWVTFTEPEIGHVGYTEEAARAEFGDDVVVRNQPMTRVDRAVAEGDTRGFIKITTRKNGAVLGATVVATRGGELISEIAHALHRGEKLQDLAETLRPYPTWSTGLTQLAADAAVEDALSGVTGAMVRGWMRLAR